MGTLNIAQDGSVSTNNTNNFLGASINVEGGGSLDVANNFDNQGNLTIANNGQVNVGNTFQSVSTYLPT